MPPYRGFCGPSNATQSLMADCERTVNWYLEKVESPAAPVGAALFPTPGQRMWVTVPDVGYRGGLSVAGRTFVVYGTGLYELAVTQIATLRGRVTQDNYPATVSYNGSTGGQLFITSGGNGYCYVLATNTLTQVLTGEATMGGMINSRFLAFNILNGKVRLSALNDGTTWDPNLSYSRSLAPDPWQAMLINAPDIWMIGEQTGEVWYDTGAFPQPFAPRPGAFFNWGTPAPFSAGVAGDYVTWVSKSQAGQGVIVATRGYAPTQISNYAVETAIANYSRAGTIADAELLVYQDQGHLCSVFSFPTGNGTWAVDMDTQAWHERSSRTAGARDEFWHPRGHVYAFGKHLVGERGTGRINELDVTFGSDNDVPIRRLRIPPPLYATAQQRLIVSRLGLLAESGLGATSGQGSNPLVMLRTSTNTKTWSNQRLASAGRLGDYSRRIQWRRCGSSDLLWVPEISVTDPIPWRLSGAEIDGSGFQQAQAPGQAA